MAATGIRSSIVMEIVSELLGHTKLATTQQSYGEIVQKKVGDEMSVMNSRIQPDNIKGMSK